MTKADWGLTMTNPFHLEVIITVIFLAGLYIGWLAKQYTTKLPEYDDDADVERQAWQLRNRKGQFV